MANLSQCLLPGLPRWLSGKESPYRWKRCRSLVLSLFTGTIPWGRKWQPTPVFSPGKCHEQRSLVGYSLWGHKESDPTQQLSMHTHLLPRLPGDPASVSPGHPPLCHITVLKTHLCTQRGLLACALLCVDTPETPNAHWPPPSVHSCDSILFIQYFVFWALYPGYYSQYWEYNNKNKTDKNLCLHGGSSKARLLGQTGARTLS